MSNRMKNFLATLAVGLLALTGYSQTVQPVSLNTNTSPPTLSGPLIDVMGALATATNWVVAPFGTYSEADSKYGGGIAAVYNITEAVGSMFRFDYLDRNFNMVSASMELQQPIVIAGKLKVTTFAFSGIATTVGGAGTENGTVQGVFGAGMDFKPVSSKHWSAAFSAEYWSARDGVQWRFSPFVWKF